MMNVQKYSIYHVCQTQAPIRLIPPVEHVYFLVPTPNLSSLHRLKS